MKLKGRQESAWWDEKWVIVWLGWMSDIGYHVRYCQRRNEQEERASLRDNGKPKVERETLKTKLLANQPTSYM